MTSSLQRVTVAGAALTFTLVGCFTAVPAAIASASPDLAPVRSVAGTVIPGKYIVVLDSGVSKSSVGAAAKRTTAKGGKVTRSYVTLGGYSANLSAKQLKDVRRDPSVAYVEPDTVVRASATQTGATWGLDRVDQTALPLNGTYSTTLTGAGVKAYIIDTGIRLSHGEFTGRVASGFTAINDGRGVADCNGHGTHVAGTVGGTTYGIAKAVTLVPVRVLDCNGSGSTSGVIAGVDWVTATRSGASVANMSLGGSASTALDESVKRSIAAGVTFAVAAGNSNADACGYSPARVPTALTVGAATRTDSRDTGYSNYGSCVDLFAPGTGITSSWYSSDTAAASLSGTSMASPHVAGVAALYLQSRPTATPAQVSDALVAGATPNVVTNQGSGTTRSLLSTVFLAGNSTPVTEPNLPPVGSAAGSTSGQPRTVDVTCTVGTTARYTGTFSAAGQSAMAPTNSYYKSTTAGLHQGCLSGATSNDFDLFLYRWNGTAWKIVAYGETDNSSTEKVGYSGDAGYYYWAVTAFKGTGSWILAASRPA